MSDEPRKRCAKCRAEHAPTLAETRASAERFTEDLDEPQKVIDVATLLHFRALIIIYALEGWCRSCAVTAARSEGRFARAPERH